VPFVTFVAKTFVVFAANRPVASALP
jgi:hypothetical protein